MEIKLNNGEILVLDEVAKKANGALLLRKEKAVILATVTMGDEQIEGDFVPLTVQYIEKSYANGKIPSGFIKREGKPSEFEILTSRLIDRSLRPLFPKHFHHPIQISVFVLSAGDEDLQVLALNAASLALYISNIPINRVINAIRVGFVNDEFISTKSAESSIDLFVAGDENNIAMIEFKSNCGALSEEKMISALEFAKAHLDKNASAYKSALGVHIKEPLFALDSANANFTNAECGLDSALDSANADFESAFEKIAQNYGAILESAIKTMGENSAILDNVKRQIIVECELCEGVVEKSIARFKREFIRNMILSQNLRVDGRKLDEIREISIKTNILPNAHGSALFTRGETQVLAICTLGAESDAQSVENLSEKGKKEKFLFHYNFPSFSTGEAYPIGSVGRRELGHGNLAKRALESSIEAEQTIRIVSEVLESNGSSSMASVCGGSLSLYAAGLNPKFLVAGIAMGLVKEGEKYAILTDIAGVEDAEGDMDFKVAGNFEGITALQMDIKISDISMEILARALDSARLARQVILEKMERAREQIVLNDNLPKSESFSVPQAKIPLIIGQGGKNIKRIIEQFEVSIDIAKDSGKITIFSANSQNLEGAKAHILDFIADSAIKVGDRFNGNIKKIAHFGAFVEIKCGMDGLIHSGKFLQKNLKMTDFSENQTVMVEVVSVRNDKIELDLC